VEKTDLNVIQNILAFLARTKMSQVDLAKLAEIDYISLNKILNGKRPPGKATARKLSQAMGVSESEIYQEPSSLANRATTATNTALITAISALNAELESIPHDLRIAFGTATPAQVAEMTRAALAVLRAADPQLTLERAKARLSQIDSPDLKPNPKRQSKS
jgi:transcriptional regulator with XRE-family HTH domain